MSLKKIKKLNYQIIFLISLIIDFVKIIDLNKNKNHHQIIYEYYYFD